MNALIDTSVLLRKLFGEPNPLREWSRINVAFASRILLLELGRAIDRCRLAGDLDDAAVVHLHEEARRVLRSVEVIALSEPILVRAASAMPTVLGSLDALHLATAVELARDRKTPIVVATHDAQLARAALSSGLDVVGV
jgi:predicted nucleic acid-binding protein